MKVITFGRSSQSNVVINDIKVSRVHCQIIQHDNGSFGIADFGSTNGTYVNGQRITGEVQLNWNDTVQIGNTLLQWQDYFRTGKLSKSNNTWIWGLVAAVAVIIFIVGGWLFYNHYSQRNIIFSGEYPPVKTITYTENGESYDIEAVEGHILMYFADGTSYFKAKNLIEQHNGKIIEQMPKFDYYLVEVAKGTESDFISQMRQEPSVEYVFLNTVYQYLSNVYILDNFKDTEESMGIPHGEGVRKTFDKNSSGYNYIQNINREGMNNVHAETTAGQYWKAIVQFITSNSACTDFFNTIYGADKNKITIVNMSFGIPGFGKRILYDDVDQSRQKDYEKNYKENLKGWAACFNQIERMGYSNFVVTKASGNEGMYNLDKVLNKLNNNDKQILQKHLILVNAVDDWNKKTNGKHYSNSTVSYNEMATAVDIREVEWPGTSFAAPKLLGWIDKITNEYKCLNAQDVLEIIRKATPQNPQQALNYENLKSEAEKRCQHETVNFTGHWATSDFNFQLSLTQAENQISGTTHSNDHGGDVSEVQYTFSGTVSGNVATVNYYSNYWEQNMQGNIKYLAEDQIEWTQIPQKGRDMPGKTILYRYIPKQSINPIEESKEENKTPPQQSETYNMRDLDENTTEITTPSGNTAEYTNQQKSTTHTGNYNGCIRAELKTSSFFGTTSLVLTNSCDINLIVIGEVLTKDFSQTMQGKEKWEWQKFEQQVGKNWSSSVGLTDVKDYRITKIIEETTEYYIEKQNKKNR